MTLPSLTVNTQGTGAVSADDLNTKVMWATNVAALRAFVGLGGMAVWMQGTTTPNDGGQGNFYYNPLATAPDDNGVTTIQPVSVTSAGRWLRQPVAAGALAPGSVTLANLTNIPELTLLGNNTSLTGPVLALTVAQVQAMFGGFAVPSGTIVSYASQTSPSGWLVCDGSAVSRTTYAALNTLASAAGYLAPWGVGDGSTTFNIPSLLGQFVRGWDSSGSVDPARVFGSGQADALQSHQHITDTPTVFVAQTSPFGDTTVSVTRTGFSTAGTGSDKYGLSNDGTPYSGYDPNPAGQVSAIETRPINVALNFIIKT